MENIEDFIPVGKNNAIHMPELASKLGVGESCAKAKVRIARRNGIQILSDFNGYWISNDENEKMSFISSMKKQALTRLKSMKGVKRSLSEFNGQMSITDIYPDKEE